MLASVLILSAVAVVALVLTFTRAISENDLARHAAARSLALAVALQAAHFAEEATTGFHDRFPELLGLPAMPVPFFVLFNVAWLAAWTASVPGLRTGRPTAFFAAWFLALAGLLNSIAHPLLAVASGSYFPGLVTSPFIGVASALLWTRLRRATQHQLDIS